MPNRFALAVLAAAALALAGTGTGCADPVRTAPVAGAPDLDGALLTLPDLPPGWRVVDSHAAAFPAVRCPRHPAPPTAAAPPATASVGRSYAGHRATATHLVESHDAGTAHRRVDDLRRALRACPRFETDTYLQSYTITDEGFVGDDSLLVHSVRLMPPDRTEDTCTAVARRGGTVHTITAEGLSCDDVRQLAVRALLMRT